eukprot:992638_1
MILTPSSILIWTAIVMSPQHMKHHGFGEFMGFFWRITNQKHPCNATKIDFTLHCPEIDLSYQNETILMDHDFEGNRAVDAIACVASDVHAHNCAESTQIDIDL